LAPYSKGSELHTLSGLSNLADQLPRQAKPATPQTKPNTRRQLIVASTAVLAWGAVPSIAGSAMRGARLMPVETEPMSIEGLKADQQATIHADIPTLSTPQGRQELLGRRGRSLDMIHLHTGERLSLVLFENEMPDGAMYQAVNRFLRDHYSGTATQMDPRLLGNLFNVMRRLDMSHGTAEIISGFRSKKTNDWLRKRSRKVARNSYHTRARALDLRIQGMKLTDLRDAARAERIGGVGYYRRSQFVHLDTGPVRAWG
jgi:uncharacterized protein YcbK (DUF882 family)